MPGSRWARSRSRACPPRYPRATAAASSSSACSPSTTPLPGIGHACGHNIIAAAAVTAGRLLAPVADDLGITVKVFGAPAGERRACRTDYQAVCVDPGQGVRPPFSSAGAGLAVMPRSSATGASNRPAVTAAAAMMLWPRRA